MKYIHTLITALALPLTLAGCDKKADAPNVSASEGVAIASDMPPMAMPAGSKMGSGSGTVTAVDAPGGKITLNHGAIPAVGWPAMTMTFAAKPGVLQGVPVGQNVDFNVTVTGDSGEVTAIRKR